MVLYSLYASSTRLLAAHWALLCSLPLRLLACFHTWTRALFLFGVVWVPLRALWFPLVCACAQVTFMRNNLRAPSKMDDHTSRAHMKQVWRTAPPV